MRDIDRRSFVRHSMMLTAALAGNGVLATAGDAVAATQSAAALGTAFLHPPASARPGAFWFWLSGNITREAITRDLEAFHRVGIGNFWLENGSLVAKFIEPSVTFMSPQWLDMFKHALSECRRLGLKMQVQNCDGWSHSGGNWISPENGDQMLECAELRLRGPSRFSGPLPMPFHRKTYKDAAILAYRTPAADRWQMKDLNPKLSTNVKATGDLQRLVDGDLETSVKFPAPAAGEIGWLEIAFPEPVQAAAVSCCITEGIRIELDAKLVSKPLFAIAAVADDGTATELAKLPHMYPASPLELDQLEWKTASFAPTTSKRWRIQFWRNVELREIELLASSRIAKWEEKSARRTYFLYPEDATPEAPADMVVEAGSVVDLTQHVDGDGKLTWDVPDGSWTVLRLGHTWTGDVTVPASDGPRPEADKMSREVIDLHFDAFAGQLAKDAPQYIGDTWTALMMDSWEVGCANWTPKMLGEFRERRGYDPVKWLPALNGHIVDGTQASERFLFDFRRTVGELVADGMFGHYRERAGGAGLQLWAEALGPTLRWGAASERNKMQPTWQQVADALVCKSRVDVPMGEFWIMDPLSNKFLEFDPYDPKEAASAAHVYGKPIASAEAFTSVSTTAWTAHPASMKAIGDRNYCRGINHYFVSNAVLQPWAERKPGLTLGDAGMRYQWTTTWFGESGGWVAYLSRCQHVLRQGLFHADVLYYLGEDVPLRLWAGALEPAPAAGLDFDACSADALLSRVAAKDGRLVLPDGMRYRLLVLSQGGRAMTPQVLGKLKDLVEAGATVVGPRPPSVSPSLENYPQCDGGVAALVEALWGDLDGTAKRVRNVGLGRVVWGLTPAEVLAADGIGLDFEAPGHEAEFAFIHRTAGESEIYFVSNQSPQSVSTDLLFRVTGKQPHIWDPVTGRQWKAELFEEVQGRTKLPLAFAPAQSFFVVFEGKPSSRRKAKALANIPAQRDRLTLEGPWQVAFDPKWGGPAHVVFDSLIDWTAHTDDGIRHYSGSATYQKSFTLQSLPPKGRRVLIDLGQVANIATVTLNGKTLPTVWTAPWQADITHALVKGTNRLEISVTNLWVNRLAKDAGLPEAQRLTWTTSNPYNASSKLLPSGLIGPVKIKEEM
jgi:alpha-L-rhamnosidase